MMLGSGTTFWANFHTESSKVAEKSSIWQFLGSILQVEAQALCTASSFLPEGTQAQPPQPGWAAAPQAEWDTEHPEEGGADQAWHWAE